MNKHTEWEDGTLRDIRKDKEKKFCCLCDEAVEKAARIMKERDGSYNKGGVSILDYGGALEDRIKTRFTWVWENALRIKAEVNSDTRPLNSDKILDLINQCKFLYAENEMHS